MQLRGKKILLTGGQGGLGRALKKSLTDRGAVVTTAGRVEGEDLLVDFGDPADMRRFCQEVAGMPFDMLINNAGLQYFGRTHEQPESSIHDMIAVNLEAPLLLTKSMLPGMIRRGGGRIVNIGSVFAGIPFPHFSSYSAVKAGLRAYSQSLRREYAGKGIRVTYVAPRALRTAMSTGPVFELLTKTRSAMDLPEIVAEKIADGLEKDRDQISIGIMETVMVHLNGLMPGLLDRALRKSRDISEQLIGSTPSHP